MAASLEMLWLAQTVEMTKDRGKGRQLPGVRAVRHWIDGDVGRDRFGFAPNSYARYRFTGVYGAYRVALRSLPGLTVGGDGWRLGSLGRELSEVVQGEVRCTRTHRRTQGKRPEPERYWEQWIRLGSVAKQNFLPTVLAEPSPSPNPERDLLAARSFPPDRGLRCRSTLRRASSRGRRGGSEVFCDNTSRLFADVARALGGGKPLEELALLSPFCELADAGVAAMNACWTAVCNGDGTTFARTSDVLARPEVASRARWRGCGRQALATRQHRRARRPIPVADALAARCLGQAARESDSFRHWSDTTTSSVVGSSGSRSKATTIKPLAPVRGGAASEYRFRIGALEPPGSTRPQSSARCQQALRDSDELDEEGDEEDQY